MAEMEFLRGGSRKRKRKGGKSKDDAHPACDTVICEKRPMNWRSPLTRGTESV